jgi:hypothetical protein
MQLGGREELVTLPLRCAVCWKSNYFKTSSVLYGVVHRVFHRRRGKMFRRDCEESEFAAAERGKTLIRKEPILLFQKRNLGAV